MSQPMGGELRLGTVRAFGLASFVCRQADASSPARGDQMWQFFLVDPRRYQALNSAFCFNGPGFLGAPDQQRSGVTTGDFLQT